MDDDTTVPIETSIVVLLLIFRMCIRKGRLSLPEKLKVLQALSWLISHTEYEGLLEMSQPDQPRTSSSYCITHKSTIDQHLSETEQSHEKNNLKNLSVL